MKTLNQEIEEVRKSKASNAEKTIALIKLGLTQTESDILVSQWKGRRAASVERFVYTFGVEMECYNIYQDIVYQSFGREGVAHRFESYNHIDGKDYYKFVSDASLSGDHTSECVSPILKGKNGFSSLKKACKALNEAGARVNRSCGLHVHIGLGRLDNASYVRIFKNYQRAEALIDSFMAESRRANNNGYCASLQGYDFSRCATKSEIENMLRSRYYKVNPQSYRKHNTIEFRQHQGTTNYEKISMWISFVAKLVQYSKSNELGNVSSLDDIPFLNSEERAFFAARIEEMKRRDA